MWHKTAAAAPSCEWARPNLRSPSRPDCGCTCPTGSEEVENCSDENCMVVWCVYMVGSCQGRNSPKKRKKKRSSKYEINAILMWDTGLLERVCAILRDWAAQSYPTHGIMWFGAKKIIDSSTYINMRFNDPFRKVRMVVKFRVALQPYRQENWRKAVSCRTSYRWGSSKRRLVFRVSFIFRRGSRGGVWGWVVRTLNMKSCVYP